MQTNQHNAIIHLTLNLKYILNTDYRNKKQFQIGLLQCDRKRLSTDILHEINIYRA